MQAPTVLRKWNCLLMRGFIDVKHPCQVWRMPHPPVRGSYWLRSRPMVHGGFLKSWMANGLQARVLALVREIVAQASVSSSDFKVYVTGEWELLAQAKLDRGQCTAS